MKESTLWLLHILTGILILFLLGFHMIVMHLNGILALLGVKVGDVLSYNSVLERGREVSHFLIYMGLLIFALFHGLYGLRSMLFEFNLKKVGERVVSWTLIFLGLVLFLVGSYSAWFMLKRI